MSITKCPCHTHRLFEGLNLEAQETYFDATDYVVSSYESSPQFEVCSWPDLTLAEIGMTGKQGWAKQKDGWGRRDKTVDPRRLAITAMSMTERILANTDEICPSVILGKTLRIGQAILSTDVQKDLLHETSTLENYMVMVQHEVEEMRNKAKMRMAKVKDLGYKGGLERLLAVHRVIVNHSHDLEQGLSLLAPHLEITKKHFEENCTTRRMEELLMEVFLSHSWVGLAEAYEFILYVRCCYLQIFTVVNVHTENISALAKEFESFNNSIIQLVMFLRDHEENYYMKYGIRIRM